MSRVISMITCLGASLILCACELPPSSFRPPPWVVPARVGTPPLPSYEEVAARYNANIRNLDRVWARADITFEFRDDRGKMQSERADDSNLICIPPYNVAMPMGHSFGKVLWPGCNEEKYWAFDLHSDERPVYVGLNDNRYKLSTEPLPSPVYPQDVPAMLGIVPLSTDGHFTSPTVELYQGRWLVESLRDGRRMLLDPETALPVRIDVIDAFGRSMIAVRLDDFQRVFKTGLAETEQPLIATRIEAWLLYKDVHVSMKLSDPQHGEGKRSIEKSFRIAFDYEKLKKAHKPRTVIELDAPATARTPE